MKLIVSILDIILIKSDTRNIYTRNLNIWLPVGLFGIFSLLCRKNNHNSTKMLISVKQFVNSFYSYFPVMLLIWYLSQLYHCIHIVPDGVWNHQCWKDICDVDYYPILSPVVLFDIIFHVSIPIQNK
jgi:hypothetical protein